MLGRGPGAAAGSDRGRRRPGARPGASEIQGTRAERRPRGAVAWPGGEPGQLRRGGGRAGGLRPGPRVMLVRLLVIARGSSRPAPCAQHPQSLPAPQRTIVQVEQNTAKALEISNYAYVIDGRGQYAHSGGGRGIRTPKGLAARWTSAARAKIWRADRGIDPAREQGAAAARHDHAPS